MIRTPSPISTSTMTSDKIDATKTYMNTVLCSTLPVNCSTTMNEMAREARTDRSTVFIVCFSLLYSLPIATATSAAVRILREQYPDVPIVGIEPAVKPAMLFMENPRVLVMATPMTIREEKLKKLMDRYRHLGEIIPLPCPGLMNFVERGDLYGDDVRQYLEELLYSYSHNEIDAVVLGCTHYPFVRKMIQEVLGDRVRVFDGGNGTAREMKRRLAEKGLLTDSTAAGIVDFQNSLTGQSHEDKIQLCKALFNKKI